MPFIGKDWRSPGEAWIKTEALGWQRAKIVGGSPNTHASSSCLSSSSLSPTSSLSSSSVHSMQDTNIKDPQSSRDSWPCEDNDTGDTRNNGKLIDRHQISDRDQSCSNFSQNVPGSSCESCLSSLLNNSNSFVEHESAMSTMFKMDLDCNNSLSPIILLRNKCDTSKNKQNLVTCDKDNNLTKQSKLTKSSNSNKKQVQTISSSSNNHNHHQSYVDEQNWHLQQNANVPHCQISLKPTKEVVMYNTISEAFCQLDFCNAIHDIRRFNYICKLLHLLITKNLTSLSGSGTRLLLSMLEHCAVEAATNKHNIHVIKNLLYELKSTIRQYECWGRPLGSSLLWQQHFETIDKISKIVDEIKLTPSSSNNLKANKTTTTTTTTTTSQKKRSMRSFSDLPVEMVREILLRLNDYKDLINASQTNNVMKNMIHGQFIWRQLCKYHFSDKQIQICLKEYRTKIIKQQQQPKTLSNSKFARISSADGQQTYRTPIIREQLGSNNKKLLKSSFLHLDKKQIDSTGNGSYSCCSNNIVDDQKQATSMQPQAIDWEQLFHHLRKKYDLKEEYPDCLLLCRYCRCLFWGSFGHPCAATQSAGNRKSSVVTSNPQVTPTTAANYNSQYVSWQHSNVEPRISVEALSRNFESPENYARRQHQRRSQQQANNNHNDQQQLVGARRVLGQLGQGVHELVLRNGQQQQQHQAHSDNGTNRQQHVNTITRDVTPKHVAISPQAFLKLFSL